MTEMRGFVFALIFIIVFAGLLSSVPVDLFGSGETPDTITPIDPSLISGFDDYENWSAISYVGSPVAEYAYDDLGGYDWIAQYAVSGYFYIGSKSTFLGIWFGLLDYVRFKSPDGIDKGTSLSFAEIDADASDGSVRYLMHYDEFGTSAGTFVIYWNSTLYTDSEDAFDNDELYFIHGMGFAEGATNNIGLLLISLLLLQLPDVPILLNLLLATPIWACIVFVLWYVIKEMIPFLG